MDIDNNLHYVILYNTAIDKIFKGYTTLNSFHNPKHFKFAVSSPKNDTDECKKNFLSFMQKNFSEFVNTTGSVDASTTFLTIVEKVKQFIALMEVKTMTGNKIVVTLHDIIDKLSFTRFDSDHCKSEKLFMAILLAIQMLHCPSPSTEREYTLKFKFAPSLLGRSGLQKSSITCSGDKTISSSNDPVAANIFRLETLVLDNALAKANNPAAAQAAALPTPETEVEEDNPAKLLEPKAEEAPRPEITGDELYTNYDTSLPSRDQLSTNSDIETYRQNVLSKIIEPINTELELELSKICDLLLISCDGSDLDKFKKLLFFKEIFASEYCLNQTQTDKCHNLYMMISNITSALQTDLLKSKSGGGSKSQRRHRCKPARKTCRGRNRKSKSKSKSKSKTHRRRRHSHVRKYKKYTSSRR